ncbi:MAG: lysylphosphatidylglycerol synthase transmembrane domain-containing protein [Candidatus Acidiferrales bacterium]
MRRPLRRSLILLLAVVVLAALLYKFHNSIALEGFRWQLLGKSWSQSNVWLLLLAVAATYAAYAIRSLRWIRFSRYLGKGSFLSVYAATLMGFACLFLLGRAGEPIRPLLIARKENLPVTGMFGVYLLERICDAGATAVFAGLALLEVSHGTLATGQGTPFMHAVRRSGAALLIAFAILVCFLIYFRLHGAGALAKRLERSLIEAKDRSTIRAKFAALIAGVSEGLHALRTWGDLGAAIAWTAVHWILVVYIYVWVAHAFGGTLANIDFSAAMLILAFTMIGSALQLPGVGGGAQVATFLVLTVLFGVEKEPAAAMAITCWLITFTSGSLVGLPLMLREGWSMGDLRREAKAERKATVEEAEAHMLQDSSDSNHGTTGEASR